jgi:aryl-alcohol dehydrogenase-like predicted oxidoreductase
MAPAEAPVASPERAALVAGGRVLRPGAQVEPLGAPLAELALGAAQFGVDRGKAGPCVPECEVRTVLDTAATSGLTLVDAAPRWGDAERVLGRSWPFPSPFRVMTKTIRVSEGLDRLEARARRSLERLGVARAHALLVDCADDLLGPDGRALWARLEKLKGDGLFQRIGISTDRSDEPVHLARRFRPDLIQIPCSMLDQRPVKDGTLKALADLGVEVQIRSVFLKGLLFMPREALPPALADAGPRLSRIRLILAESRADPLQAALAFARSQPEASAAIVGVGSAAELRAVLAAANAPVPDLDWSALALDHPAALDPRLWDPANDLSSAA